MFEYTIQPLVQPIVKPNWQPVGQPRLYRVYKHSTSCPTGCFNRLYEFNLFDSCNPTSNRSRRVNIQPVVQPVWQPVEQPAASCKQTFNRLLNRLDNRSDNHWYSVNGVLRVDVRCFSSRRGRVSVFHLGEDRHGQTKQRMTSVSLYEWFWPSSLTRLNDQ